MKERWYLQTKKADFNEISRKFNISPILARLLRNRNVIGDENIKKYLSPDIERLSSPWMFKDMDKAVDILKIKIAAGNRIRVICDYDVDGVCSGYILYRSLKKLGAVVDVVVPHRIEDGYGINENLIKKAFDQGIDTILTCDNGIAAYNQVEYAKSLGMTIIVTDHHEVPYTETEQGREYIIPKADAVINHKQKDCGYPFKELCGAMVALQLISALSESYGVSKRDVYQLLPYATLATICDVVELQGENRMVVQYGLKMIKNCKDVGLNALIDACEIKKESIDSYHVGFVLGPCINASGRLDTAKRAMELLCETDREKAHILAKSLKELNDERKDMTEEGTRRAIEIAKDYDDNVLVIYLKDCHESIAGIIAGRVRERCNKPVIVLTDAKDCVKGSGRSIEEYDMYEELCKVKDLFLKFGGHKMAAGVSLPKENIELLRKRLNDNSTLTEDDLCLKVWIDMQLPIEYISMNLVEELKTLTPFGKGNEKPIFADKNLKIKKLQILGKAGNVLKLTIENSTNYRMTAIMFDRTQEFMGFIKEKFGQEEINKALLGQNNAITFMATFYPTINEFRGNIDLQIVIDRFC